jgi:hypothetical protein
MATARAQPLTVLAQFISFQGLVQSILLFFLGKRKNTTWSMSQMHAVTSWKRAKEKNKSIGTHEDVGSRHYFKLFTLGTFQTSDFYTPFLSLLYLERDILSAWRLF